MVGWLRALFVLYRIAFFAVSWVHQYLRIHPVLNVNQFPKILFVHDFRPDSLVTADLIRQLLLGYPMEKLVWWSCRQTGLHAQPDLRAGKLYEFPMPDRLVPHVRWNHTKAWLLEHFWVQAAARHLTRTIAEVQPDLVCSLLYGWSVPVLRKASLPAGQRLHVSLWDFPDSVSGQKNLGTARSQRFVAAIHDLVRKADSFDAICPGTLSELAAHTGRQDGLMVHSGFEPKHLAALAAADSSATDDVLRLAYVGTIISESGFLETLAALKQIRSTLLPQKISLEFFGGRHYKTRPWFEPEWMVEHGLFTDEGLVAALRRCSWGIVVMDPTGEDLRYSRFSFPNKVGTYLSAGVPVLGFGHPQSSLAQIMQEHRLGRFTSATGRDELKTFLAESLQLPSPRNVFREDILQCARTEFNAVEMRTQLWQRWGGH
jgi:hypothetical protein